MCQNNWDCLEPIHLNHDFELYYPEHFRDSVQEALSVRDRNEKRKRKKALLDQVENWIREDEDKAKGEFRKSASEVIELLQSIEKKVVRAW